MVVIYEWVRNVVIYLILNTIIMNLLGNSSYKKYVSIVSGMIMLLIVVSPFLKLLDMDGILDYYLNANIYQADVSDFQSELRLMEDKQIDAIYAGLKERIREQVTLILQEENLYLYDLYIVINQDATSDSFGQIKLLSIDAGYLEDEGIPAYTIDIEKIMISDIKNNDVYNDENNGSVFKYDGQKKKSEMNLPSPEEINIKKRLSEFYNMKQDNINISIKKG